MTWPRLSVTLVSLFPAHPHRCLRCGAEADLSRWQEHDDGDRRETIIIVLCEPCSDRVIEKHPRLYRRLEHNEPWPGTEAFCLDCRHRDGVRCTHPDLKANGGPGLGITAPKPETWFLCPGGATLHYPGPPTACVGRDAGDRKPAEIIATIRPGGSP